MTASRDALHHLIDELPEDQVPAVTEELRRRTKPAVSGPKSFAWIAAGPANNGRADNADRVDELLAQGFGRD